MFEAQEKFIAVFGGVSRSDQEMINSYGEASGLKIMYLPTPVGLGNSKKDLVGLVSIKRGEPIKGLEGMILQLFDNADEILHLETSGDADEGLNDDDLTKISTYIKKKRISE